MKSGRSHGCQLAQLSTCLHTPKVCFIYSFDSLSTRTMEDTLYFHYRNYFPTTMTTSMNFSLNAWPEDERDRKRSPARI